MASSRGILSGNTAGKAGVAGAVIVLLLLSGDGVISGTAIAVLVLKRPCIGIDAVAGPKLSVFPDFTATGGFLGLPFRPAWLLLLFFFFF